MNRPYHHHDSSFQVRIIKSVALLGLVLFLATISYSSFKTSYPYTSQEDYNNSFMGQKSSKSSKSKPTVMNSVDKVSDQHGPNSSGQNDQLGSFLKENKADFMKALSDGSSSLDGWVIVMGEYSLS